MQEKLSKDLLVAMRARDQVRMDTIRQVKAAATNQEIHQSTPLTDAHVEEIIGRLVRQHRESIDMFSKGNRLELAEKEKAELAILQAYLPQQLSVEEVTALARDAAAQVGALGPSDKGKVMGKLMPLVKGKAEGKVVNDTVIEVLARIAG